MAKWGSHRGEVTDIGTGQHWHATERDTRTRKEWLLIDKLIGGQYRHFPHELTLNDSGAI